MTEQRSHTSQALLHLSRWKDAYEVLGILLAISISALSLFYSHRVFNIQSEEFIIRNRPYLTLTRPVFGAQQTTIDEQVIPHSIIFELRNASEIPATEVSTVATILLNEKIVSTTTLSQTASIKDDAKTTIIFLDEEVYSKGRSLGNKLEVHVITTYKGMLLKEPLYETITTARYYHAEDVFKISGLQIR